METARRAILVALRFALPVVAALTLGVSTAGAKPLSFDFHAGDGFAGIVSPEVSAAANGDTVTIDATGTFRPAGHKAKGGGTFVHRAANGTVLGSGTFDVERLTSFQSFGCGVAEGQPLPPDFCGGKAVMEADVVGHPASGGTEEFDAVFTITCLVGDRVPAGAEEVAALDIPGVIDFNKPVSGENLFVKKPAGKREKPRGERDDDSKKPAGERERDDD